MMRRFTLLTTLALAAALLAGPATALAHCDTLDGPVVGDARAALDAGRVDAVLKWVPAADEEAVRSAFDRTVAVRALGPEARQLADTWFFETLVRVHRAGEGAPYTGLRPAGAAVEPGVAAGDRAIAAGSPDELAAAIAARAEHGVRERFARVADLRKHADRSTEDGRTYVAAYVDFVHYVERVHRAVSGTSSHAH